MITPLQNEYYFDKRFNKYMKNPHGIRSVLKDWEKAINDLDTYGLPKDERFSRQYDRKGSTYYGYYINVLRILTYQYFHIIF